MTSCRARAPEPGRARQTSLQSCLLAGDLWRFVSPDLILAVAGLAALSRDCSTHAQSYCLNMCPHDYSSLASVFSSSSDMPWAIQIYLPILEGALPKWLKMKGKECVEQVRTTAQLLKEVCACWVSKGKMLPELPRDLPKVCKSSITLFWTDGSAGCLCLVQKCQNQTNVLESPNP